MGMSGIFGVPRVWDCPESGSFGSARILSAVFLSCEWNSMVGTICWIPYDGVDVRCRYISDAQEQNTTRRTAKLENTGRSVASIGYTPAFVYSHREEKF